MRFSTLNEWLKWQEGLHPKSIDLGLERPRKVLNRLNLSSPDHLTITIAGTNGKGSTVAILESILIAAGYRIGSYTSPHLLSYNERIKLDGVPVSDQMICNAFDELDHAREGESLTYFEFGTLAAFSIFNKEAVDIVLLEVGLGGRLDAVNLLDADLAIITAIDIDHIGWLGSDRETIGREKAGIMREKGLAVCSDPQPPHSVIDYAQKLGTELIQLEKDYNYLIDEDGCWTLKFLRGIDMGTTFESLPRPNLKGEAQYQNCAGAIAGLMSLGDSIQITTEHISNGLKSVTLLGRFQKIADSPEIIVDVAHNPQSARHLANNLTNQKSSGARYAVVAMLSDKDQQESLKALSGLFKHWLVAGIDTDRGDSGDVTSEIIESEMGEKVSRFDSILLAYQKALELAGNGDQIIVFGSFFTVSDILRLELDNSGEG